MIDNVGGPQLVEAWSTLAPGGSLQSVGWTSGQPAAFPAYSTIGPAKSLTSFVNEREFAADLAILVQLVAEGALRAEIGWHGSWEDVAEATKALRGRQVNGKAVLDIDTHGRRHAEPKERAAMLRAPIHLTGFTCTYLLRLADVSAAE